MVDRSNIDRAKKRKLLSAAIKQLQLEKEMRLCELVDDFRGMSLQARNLGRAARIYEKMLTDKEKPTIFLGLAGPLIACGLRNVITKMIELNLVDVIVSTGAIIYQDFYQATGGKHYEGSPEMDDAELADLWIDRIYDTLVDDELFYDLDHLICKFAETLEPRNYSSREFVWELAKTVNDKNSIIAVARKNDVPIFVPALNDSSIGIGLTGYYAMHLDSPKMTIDAIKDNYEIVQIISDSASTAAIYVGGGVPKNFINDAVVTARFDFGVNTSGHKYAIQLTTALPFDGALSGSTLKEAKSWGKIQKGGTTAMVYVEASIGLPLLVGYIVDRGVYLNRPKKRFEYSKRLEYVKKG